MNHGITPKNAKENRPGRSHNAERTLPDSKGPLKPRTGQGATGRVPAAAGLNGAFPSLARPAKVVSQQSQPKIRIQLADPNAFLAHFGMSNSAAAPAPASKPTLSTAPAKNGLAASMYSGEGNTQKPATGPSPPKVPAKNGLAASMYSGEGNAHKPAAGPSAAGDPVRTRTPLPAVRPAKDIIMSHLGVLGNRPSSRSSWFTTVPESCSTSITLWEARPMLVSKRTEKLAHTFSPSPWTMKAGAVSCHWHLSSASITLVRQ